MAGGSTTAVRASIQLSQYLVKRRLSSPDNHETVCLLDIVRRGLADVEAE
jgi:hypothetical protein